MKSTDSSAIRSQEEEKDSVERNKEIVNHTSEGKYHKKMYLSDVPKANSI